MNETQELKITVTEPGSEAFYRELVNIMAQYRQLMKKPEKKLRDMFKSFRSNMIIMIVIAAIALLVCVLSFMWRDLTAESIVLLAMALAMIFLYAYNLKNYNKAVKRFIDEHQTTTVTLDAQGIENKTEKQTIRLAWDNVAFARVFKESVGFLSSNSMGMVMTIDRKYEGELLRWMGANCPAVKVIGAADKQ